MKLYLSIRQLIRLSLAVGLLAAFLAPGPGQAQGSPGAKVYGRPSPPPTLA